MLEFFLSLYCLPPFLSTTASNQLMRPNSMIYHWSLILQKTFRSKQEEETMTPIQKSMHSTSPPFFGLCVILPFSLWMLTKNQFHLENI